MLKFINAILPDGNRTRLNTDYVARIDEDDEANLWAVDRFGNKFALAMETLEDSVEFIMPTCEEEDGGWFSDDEEDDDSDNGKLWGAR